jgi:quercetin dioxygenase-like cupin family protein
MSAISHTSEVIDVQPLGPSLTQAATSLLYEANGMRVMRLVVRKGAEMRMHQAAGATALLSLEGRVEVVGGDGAIRLSANQLVCLPAGMPFALKGLDDASLVSITARPMAANDSALEAGATAPLDPVEEASEESFPASDPPAFVSRRRR